VNEKEPNRNSAASIIAATLALSIGYAILRYHIVGSVPWTDFPLFILNKGLCLAAYVLLTMNFTLGPLSNLGAPVSQGWLMPAGWHGGLPPISLVAFAFFSTGYVINLFGRE
jgi:hypothetical protein